MTSDSSALLGREELGREFPLSGQGFPTARTEATARDYRCAANLAESARPWVRLRLYWTGIIVDNGRRPAKQE